MSIAGTLGAGADAAAALGKGVFSLGKDITKMGVGLGKFGMGMGKAGLNAAKKGAEMVRDAPGDHGASMLSSGSAALNSAMHSTKDAAQKAAHAVATSANDAVNVLKEDALDDLGYVRSSSSSDEDADLDVDKCATAEQKESLDLDATQLSSQQQVHRNSGYSLDPRQPVNQTVRRQVAQFCTAFEEFLHVHCAEHNLDTSGVQDAMLRVLAKEAQLRPAASRKKQGNVSTATSARRASQAKFLKRGLRCSS